MSIKLAEKNTTLQFDLPVPELEHEPNSKNSMILKYCALMQVDSEVRDQPENAKVCLNCSLPRCLM